MAAVEYGSRANTRQSQRSEVGQAPSSAPAARPVNRAPPTEKEVLRYRLERAKVMERWLREEPQDNWGAGAEVAIHQGLRREEFAGTTLERVVCRSTICRTEVNFADEEARVRFVNTFASSVAPLRRGTMNEGTTMDGRSALTIYTVRDGFELPRFTREQLPAE